jgi:hypothetical protein
MLIPRWSFICQLKRKEISVSTRPSITHSSRWSRFWKPAAAITTGGTVLITWFEEIIATAAEFIGVISIFVMTGIIYLFNVYVFKSAAPKADDLNKK